MNPAGHKVNCRCSEECAEHTRQYMRDWKARNADKVDSYRQAERAKKPPRPPRLRREPKPPRPQLTEAEIAERRILAYQRKLERNRLWKQENPDGISEQGKRYREKNTARIREYTRAYRRTNADQRREYNRIWAQANADKLWLYRQNRASRPDRTAREAASQARWRAANSDYVKQVRRAWMADRAAVVNPRASNVRAPWSDAEIRILLDPALSATEAALMLGRTVESVYNKRWKIRRTAA